MVSAVIGNCSSDVNARHCEAINEPGISTATMAPTSDETSTKATTPHTSSKIIDSTAASKKKALIVPLQMEVQSITTSYQLSVGLYLFLSYYFSSLL